MAPFQESFVWAVQAKHSTLDILQQVEPYCMKAQTALEGA